MISEKMFYKTVWTIRKFDESAGDDAYEKWLRGEVEPYETSVIDGNLLLNEGIASLWDLAIGAGSPTAFSNANARLGVGDSSTAESASQTDLQAVTNKTYASMEASYPARSSQTVTWRAVFASGDANYAWNEFCVDNGASALVTLNLKVSSQWTKASGQTWTLDLSITLS
jgi:hypothetical protein